MRSRRAVARRAEALPRAITDACSPPRPLRACRAVSAGPFYLSRASAAPSRVELRSDAEDHGVELQSGEKGRMTFAAPGPPGDDGKATRRFRNPRDISAPVEPEPAQADVVRVRSIPDLRTTSFAIASDEVSPGSRCRRDAQDPQAHARPDLRSGNPAAASPGPESFGRRRSNPPSRRRRAVRASSCGSRRRRRRRALDRHDSRSWWINVAQPLDVGPEAHAAREIEREMDAEAAIHRRG